MARPLVQPFAPARWPYPWRPPALGVVFSVALPLCWLAAFELRQHFDCRLGLLPPATVWPIDTNVLAMTACLYIGVASLGARWVYSITLPRIDPRILRGLLAR